jgi:hypothetical protein
LSLDQLVGALTVVPHQHDQHGEVGLAQVVLGIHQGHAQPGQRLLVFLLLDAAADLGRFEHRRSPLPCVQD